MVRGADRHPNYDSTAIDGFQLDRSGMLWRDPEAIICDRMELTFEQWPAGPGPEYLLSARVDLTFQRHNNSPRLINGHHQSQRGEWKYVKSTIGRVNFNLCANQKWNGQRCYHIHTYPRYLSIWFGLTLAALDSRQSSNGREKGNGIVFGLMPAQMRAHITFVNSRSISSEVISSQHCSYVTGVRVTHTLTFPSPCQRCYYHYHYCWMLMLTECVCTARSAHNTKCFSDLTPRTCDCMAFGVREIHRISDSPHFSTRKCVCTARATQCRCATDAHLSSVASIRFSVKWDISTSLNTIIAVNWA